MIGFAATERLEIIFDTLKTSRKYQNFLKSPKMALVIGWDDAQTLQIEGIADEPKGSDLERLKARYFEVFPDGARARGVEGHRLYPRDAQLVPLQRFPRGAAKSSR